MSIIDFKPPHNEKLKANERAEELIQYVRDNCTQSQAMLDFLDQPFVKQETARVLNNFKVIEHKVNKDKN